MKGKDFIDVVMALFEVKTDKEIASCLGVTQSAVISWRKGQINNTSIKKHLNNGFANKIESELITAICEYKLLEEIETRKDVLANCIGVYVFYDSNGRPVYIGKTKKNLYFEMNNALDRKSIRHEVFLSNKKKSLAKASKLVVRDIAKYFSSYEVDKNIIDIIESLLIRTCYNNLFNTKIPQIEYFD